MILPLGLLYYSIVVTVSGIDITVVVVVVVVIVIWSISESDTIPSNSLSHSRLECSSHVGFQSVEYIDVK